MGTFPASPQWLPLYYTIWYFPSPAYFAMKPTVRKVYFDMVWSKFEKPNDTNYPGRCYVEKTTKFYPKMPNHFFSNLFLSKLNPFENPKNVTDRLQLTQILIFDVFFTQSGRESWNGEKTVQMIWGVPWERTHPELRNEPPLDMLRVQVQNL